MIIIIILIILLSVLLYIKVVKPYNYWTDRGVKQRKQVYLLGDNAGVMLRKESFFDMFMNIYKVFPNERYCGLYQTTLPTLMIRSPELIKQIAVKDFDHFVNHRKFIADGADPIWSKNLFALQGNQWRHMRSTLSPSFTSSKMRTIFSLISDCADSYMKYFKKTNKTMVIELKDMFTRYTNDVIATVAFGIKCDSINEKENEFYMMGRKATAFTFWRDMVFYLYTLAPKICRIVGLKLFPTSVTVFFKNLVKDTIKIREEQGIIRPDMMQLLLEARKKRKKFDGDNSVMDAGFAVVEETENDDDPKQEKLELTDIDIAAQALIFFFGGFDSVATTMCFMGYELTIHPDIQKTLQEEIDETMKECNEKLTYEALLKMKYMDMVTSETLRKWPIGVGTDRVCNKPYTIEAQSENEKPVHLQPGDIIWFPINGIHHDPKYWPNPDKFDPERFNDENKYNIQPYTYIPFGLGPRNCISSRLALLEVKAILFHLLYNYNFVVTEKTDIHLNLSKSPFNLLADYAMWIGLESRNK